MVQFHPAKRQQKAVTVLVHGLNNKPSSLSDLASFLTQHGSGVVLVSLTGHSNDKKNLLKITKSTWLEDLNEAFLLAKKKNQPDHPIYFIGFSIGALINLNLLNSRISYDKMVLLAPAIAPKWQVYLAIPFYKLSDRIPVVSIAPAQYMVYSYLPVRVYRIMLELIDSLKEHKYRHANIPTLVAVDPKDETMSFKKLKELIIKFKLTRWQVFTLDSKEVTKEIKFHHLIIDKQSMGERNWQNLTQKIKDFFSL